MKKDVVIEVAKKARVSAEQCATEMGSWDANTLNCMCAICSFFLWSKLKEHNINSSIVYRPGHIFLLVGAEYILDITATQFSYRHNDVEFSLIDHVEVEWGYIPDYWNIQDATFIDSEEEFNKLVQDWPSFQQPMHGNVLNKMNEYYHAACDNKCISDSSQASSISDTSYSITNYLHYRVQY